MIKSIALVLCLLFLSTESFAQGSYMEEIVDKSCSCLGEISEDITGQALEIQLGVCILTAASPYQKEILAEYGLDLNKINEEGEQIGVIIGGKMASKCPNALVAVSQRTMDEESSIATKTISSNGTIESVSTDFLIHFSIKNEKGRTEKYYWYSFVESDTDLIRDYTNLKGKNVSIEYHKEEFFDPKIMEYRPLNIIDVLTIN